MQRKGGLEEIVQSLESMYVRGMAKAYNEEQLEMQKLDAIKKQVEMEKERLAIFKIKQQQEKQVEMLRALR